MPTISLELSEVLLAASSECATLHLSRAEYMSRALERMNRETRARLRADRRRAACLRVRRESVRSNAEFAAIEEGLDA